MNQRRLWMRFRRVPPANADAYRRAVGEAATLAASLDTHFWAFEADSGDGLTVEFLEGRSDDSLSELDAATEYSLSVSAGGPSIRPGTGEGASPIKCSEIWPLSP